MPTTEPTPGELLDAAIAYTSAWRRLVATTVLAGHTPPATVMLAFAVAYDWVTEQLIDPTVPEPPDEAA